MAPSEYEVFSAWIDNKAADKTWNRHLDQFVINTETDLDTQLLTDDNGQPITLEKAVEGLGRKAPLLRQETLDAFRKANAVQGTIGPALHPTIRYQVVTPSQLEPMFKRGGNGWMGYYKQFPRSQGVVTFSRVGFSPDGMQALFFYKNVCGELCGEANYAVMQKHNDGWQVEKEINMWVY